jgi:heptosyltransferase-2
LVSELKAEGYTHVVDLHKNLRSYWLRLRLGVPATTFAKANGIKNRMVWFKSRKLAAPHIVERYMQAVTPLGAVPDDKGLDFPLLADMVSQVAQEHENWNAGKDFVAVVLGATWYTKRWPEAHTRRFVEESTLPVVLLGGPAESELAKRIAEGLPASRVRNLAGKTSLQQSAAWLQRAQWVLTGDTGLMHIAAALQKPVVVLWGNTTPRFGMAPFRTPHLNLEVAELGCRPCSRIGYKGCPKGHFNCMQLLGPDTVRREADTFLAQLNSES